MSTPSSPDLLALYERMLLIRAFEERLEKLFHDGLVKGTCHLCIGQEAVAVGACAAIDPSDYVVSTHRGHGHFLAKGGDPKRMMAEIFGKVDGYCGGRGGSQHMARFDIGFLGSNGITAGGVPIATGAALAIKRQGSKNVVLCFLGDGALNQGAAHEAMNMAAIWKLPIVFACENNGYAMSTPTSYAFAINRLSKRAKGYGIDARTIDGNDVLTVRDETRAAAERARSGKGAQFIEYQTYRFCGHSRSDRRVYRTREEEEQWRERCPIRRFRAWLMEHGLLDPQRDNELHARVAEEIAQAETFAKASPFPDPSTATAGVFA